MGWGGGLAWGMLQDQLPADAAVTDVVSPDAAVPADERLGAVDELARLEPIARASDWLSELLSGVPVWGRALIITGVAVLIAMAIQWVAYFLLRQTFRGARHELARKLIERTKHRTRLLAIVIGAAVGLAVCEERGLLADWLRVWWPDITTVLTILSVTWVLVGLIAGVDDMLLAKYKLDVRDNLKARRMHTQVAVLSRTIRILVGVVGVAIALATFDQVEEIGTSLLASAGIVGIAVGFAARPVLGNIIAGMQIALTQPIRLDDAVVIAGEWGWIEEITTTYVVVRIWDQRRLIVPFSKIIEEPFQNWTRKSADILGAVELFVDYTCDVDVVRAKVLELIEASPKWDKRAKVLQVIDTSERTIKLRALMTAADSPTAWDLRCEVREGAINWLRTEHPEWLPRERQVNLGGPSESEASAGGEERA
jgi:small-conductance mechanosensitive channel